MVSQENIDPNVSKRKVYENDILCKLDICKSDEFKSIDCCVVELIKPDILTYWLSFYDKKWECWSHFSIYCYFIIEIGWPFSNGRGTKFAPPGMNQNSFILMQGCVWLIKYTYDILSSELWVARKTLIQMYLKEKCMKIIFYAN